MLARVNFQRKDFSNLVIKRFQFYRRICKRLTDSYFVIKRMMNIDKTFDNILENINSLQSHVSELEAENKKIKIIINDIFDRCDNFITVLEDFRKMLIDKENYDKVLKEYKVNSPDDFVRKIIKNSYDLYFYLLEKKQEKEK